LYSNRNFVTIPVFVLPYCIKYSHTVLKLSRNAPERHTGTFWKGGTPYRNFWRRSRRNARLLQCLMKQKLSKVAISVLLAATKCTKFVFCRGAGGAHDAPPDPLVGWDPSPFPSPRHLDSHAFGVRIGAFGASLPAFRHFFFHNLTTASATPDLRLPSQPLGRHHRPLVGTKLYCLVTEAHVS